ncbi:MAG: dephospho-CoA kinase [Gammaproteobacteria bacterium]|jgi:dephospho-CoA kinase|nr:dephospho-CoA kinase [Gammaproteobacteria bacterium]
MNTDEDQNAILLVALTGGIASGKSAVSDRFAQLGVPIVDTDLIARQVVEPGSTGLDEIARAFGREMLDEQGRLDRGRLRELVFADEAARRRLEALLHPLIAREARRQVRQHRDADYVILVVPLLVETGLFEDADRVLVVDVPESVQIERLMAREGIDAGRAARMLSAQASREERLAAASDVIDNSGPLERLDQQVEQLHARYRALSRRRRNRRSGNG